MNFVAKEIKDKNVWEDFYSGINKKTFLNSWTWGLVRKSMGDKVFRIGIWHQNELLAVFFASKIKSKKGSFLLLPHCPSVKKESSELIIKLISEIKKIGREEKVSFIRMAPIWEEDSSSDKQIKKEGFLKSSSLVFPEKSWELDLNQSEEEILSKMRKGTRYTIKKSLKESKINTYISKKESDIDNFYNIYKETSVRHKFKPFPLEYIKKEFGYFSKNDESILILAENKGKCVAGAFLIFWQNNAFYHHGASVGDRENISASHLIQWEGIKEAKKRKCQKYNFWAISPFDNIKHRWDGLTFFKKGFGGYPIFYGKTKDFPFSKRYLLTYFYEKIKG